MTDISYRDEYMQRAFNLALKGEYTARPNPIVGCVIVKDNQIVGEGFHKYFGAAHAEIMALDQAREKAEGSDVYVTLEPCNHQGKTPPCCDALVNANVKNIYVAIRDSNDAVAGKGIEMLVKAGINVEVIDDQGKARFINRDFFCRIEKKRPWVRIKMAVSMDGRTIPSVGQSPWISNLISRRDVQSWRARSDALVVGCGTVMADNPLLNLRLNEIDPKVDALIKQPLRVVLDSRLQTNPQSKIYSHNDGSTSIIATCSKDEQLIQSFESENIKVLSFDHGDDKYVPINQVLKVLAQDYQVNEVQVEGGSTLVASLLEQGLCDEMLIYTAPVLIGSHSLSLVESAQMNKNRKLVWDESVILGDNTRVLAHFEDCE